MKRAFLIISAGVLLLGAAAAGFWYFQCGLKAPEAQETALSSAETLETDPVSKQSASSEGTLSDALTGSESAVGTEENFSDVLGDPSATALTQTEVPAQESSAAGTSAAPSEKRRKFQTVGDFQKDGADRSVSEIDPQNTVPGSSTITAPGNVSGTEMNADGNAIPAIPDPYAVPSSGFQPNAALAENGGAAETTPFALPSFPAADRNASTSRILVNSVPREVENGLIIPIYEVDVPAEEAGVMRKLYVQDFAQIQKDDVLVQIDDRQAVMAVNVAEAKKESAEIQMKNDVNVRYAIAAHAVADAEIKKADEANSKVKNTVPVVEYNRLVLSRTQAELQIEQAQQELKVAAQNYNVAMAELDAAKLDQTKFEIHSPHDGVVMELYRKEGEWLKPGDPILRLVQMNPIRYSFRIESKTPPESIFNRPVTIYVPALEREFSGKVTFIKPSHDIGDMYQVWVDIENTWQAFEDPGEEELQKGYWILQPGMRAEVKSIGGTK